MSWVSKSEWNKISEKDSTLKLIGFVDISYRCDYNYVQKWCEKYSTGYVTHFYGCIYFQKKEDKLLFTLMIPNKQEN